MKSYLKKAYKDTNKQSSQEQLFSTYKLMNILRKMFLQIYGSRIDHWKSVSWDVRKYLG